MVTKPKRRNPHPPKLPKLRLTKTAIAQLPVPKDGYLVQWDAGEPGLGVRIMPSGRRDLVLAGPAPKITIGSADLIAPEIARKKARELAAEVELGGDPSARRRAAA